MARRAGCCCSTEHLTVQEVAVIALVAQGLGNHAIGSRLLLSEHTVASHIGNAMRRLGARCRAEMVARSYVQGILDPDAWPPAGTGRRCITWAGWEPDLLAPTVVTSTAATPTVASPAVATPAVT